MSSSIGVESRVSIFMDKLSEQIVNAVALPTLDRDLDIIHFIETDKPEFDADGHSLPAFRMRWQGIAQPHTYRSMVSDKGRLEITYSHAVTTSDNRIAERYMEAVRQIVTELLYTKKQLFGSNNVLPLLGIPGPDPLNPHVVQLQDQYEVLIK